MSLLLTHKKVAGIATLSKFQKLARPPCPHWWQAVKPAPVCESGMADSHHDFSTISAAAADTKLVNCTGFASSLQADRQAVARADGGPDQKIKQPMLTPHRFKAPAPALAPVQAGMCAGRHAPACVR